MVRIPDIYVVVDGAFQFHHRQRKPVNKADDIRATRLFRSADGHLIDHHKTVVLRLVKIHHQSVIVDKFFVATVLYWNPFQQPVMEGFVTGNQIRAFSTSNTGYNLFEDVCGQMRVDFLQARG